jgi:hypothetical protein
VTTGQFIRVVIIWVTAWLMFDIMSVPIRDPDTQFWLGVVFAGIVFVNSCYAWWMIYTKEPHHPSTVQARIRNGLRRGEREARGK